MWTIRRDQRGVSNIIVVVLGLVIIVIITSNVILWSYEMNQLDWEKMREDITIVGVTRVRDVWSYNPSGYTLDGSTSWVSGSVSNLTSDDGVYMTFRSYYSGTDTSDFVDNNTSDVDSSADKGTHSSFSAQQAGPDLINDTLTEEDTGSGSASIWLYVNTDDKTRTDWTRVGANPYLDAIDYNSSYVYVSGNNLLVGDFGFADSGKSTETINSVAVQLYARQSIINIGLEVFVWDSSSWASLGTQLTPDSWGWMNWTATTVLDTWAKIDGAKIYIMTAAAAGTYEVDCARLQVDYTNPENYELDLEVQWTSVDYDETNEELCIYVGNTGTEDLRVDYWTGSTWSNLFTDLTANNWNNVSVSLTSATFKIRFKGGSETSDTSQDSWAIDVTLLHVWSDEYTSEVEFTGSSNMEIWSQLNWTVDSAWTIGSVSATLQLYNYTLDGYSASGNGYMAYTSDGTPNADETRSQTIDVNPTHFRNATGYWKVKVEGVRATDTQFDFKVDWIEFKVAKTIGTIFTFENGGSLTCHLVSLWVINSTVHEYYDVGVFVNSGDTLSYSRMDIILPSGQYTVKVVTERGNVAVYSGS